jgi:hypothetical protein
VPKQPTDDNSKLMQECGAKPPYDWNPEPTDHIKYQMNRGDATAQVVGWVKWHTTRGVRRDGKIRRSAWAMDDKGKFLTIKHAALDLGWKIQTAFNNFAAAQAEGLIRIEKDAPKVPGRIGLCADIPNSGRRKGKLNNFVQNGLPPQLLEKIESLSVVDRRLFESAYGLFQQWRKESLDDVVTQVRRKHALVEDSILQSFCLVRERKAKDYQAKTTAKVDVPEIPDFVHLVQDQPAANCTTPKTDVVQNRPPLQQKNLPTPRPAEAESININTATAATSQRKQPQQQQSFDPSAYPLTDSQITAKFPACSLEYRCQIVQAALALGDPRTNDRIIAEAVKAAHVVGQRSAALYIKTVPEALGAWLRDADRRKTA